MSGSQDKYSSVRQPPFNVDLHLDVKVSRVLEKPASLERERLQSFILDKMYQRQKEWGYQEALQLEESVINSSLTVGQWLKENDNAGN